MEIKALIYLIIIIFLVSMFVFAWKELIRTLCRTYLIDKRKNIILSDRTAEEKKYLLEYVDRMIKASYTYSLIENIAFGHYMKKNEEDKNEKIGSIVSNKETLEITLKFSIYMLSSYFIIFALSFVFILSLVAFLLLSFPVWFISSKTKNIYDKIKSKISDIEFTSASYLLSKK